MTRKIFNILVMLSIAATMFLSSCTAAGLECGLLGKWEYSLKTYNQSIMFTFEFRNDDKVVVETNVNNVETKGEDTVKSVSNHTIKFDDGTEIDYRNLTCDSVEFKIDSIWMEFTKVY